MRDSTSFIVAVIACALIAVAVIVTGKLKEHRQQKPAEDHAKREYQAKLRKMIEAKTHVQLADGSVAPKCRYCDDAATMRPFEWVRDTGIVDLVRRMFGAPARVRIGRSTWAEPVACEAHDPLVFEEFRIENAEYEIDRAKLESEWETRRARFQREGIHERVLAKIEKHQREIGGRRRQKSEATAKVLPFTSSQRTGTESK